MPTDSREGKRKSRSGYTAYALCLIRHRPVFRMETYVARIYHSPPGLSTPESLILLSDSLVVILL